MQMNKLVSVVIPVFNSEKTIIRALKSVLAQTYRPLEVIIVDDCSHDSTYSQIFSFDFKDLGFKYQLNNVNLWPGLSRNVGIEISDWYYVAFLDSDDEWILNDKIQAQVSFLIKNREYEFVSTYTLSDNRNSDFSFESDIHFRQKILCNYLAQTSTWLLTKDLLQKCWLFSKGRSEDYEYLLRIWKITKCFCVPRVATFYHYNCHSDYNSSRVSSYFKGLILCFLFRKFYPNFYASFLNRLLRPILIMFNKL
jgi:teichuronic acid biosynthesis glycosyltransferase TuaG